MNDYDKRRDPTYRRYMELKQRHYYDQRDLDDWRKIFEEAQYDNRSHEVFAHENVKSNGQPSAKDLREMVERLKDDKDYKFFAGITVMTDEATNVCVKCKEKYKYAEKAIGFECWGCKSGY